jgi:hypothetical protein
VKAHPAAEVSVGAGGPRPRSAVPPQAVGRELVAVSALAAPTTAPAAAGAALGVTVLETADVGSALATARVVAALVVRALQTAAVGAALVVPVVVVPVVVVPVVAADRTPRVPAATGPRAGRPIAD